MAGESLVFSQEGGSEMMLRIVGRQACHFGGVRWLLFAMFAGRDPRTEDVSAGQ